MQIDKKSIRNILVVRNDRFGEFLLNIPAMRALRETFTDARIIAAVNPYVKELAENIPFIDEVIEWGQEGHSLSKKAGLVSLLRKKRVDIAVMLNPSKDFNVFAYLAGIPLRAGYDRKWGFLLTHKMPDKKYLGEKHEIEYNLELAALIGAKTQDKSLTLRLDEKGADTLAADFNIRDLHNLVALHPWTSDPVKQWPYERFRDLAGRLIREEGAPVVIIGAKEDLSRSAEFFGDFDGNLINLTGRTTLMQLAAVLKKCKLLVSGDSGPVHLAGVVGTKTLAIFRNDIPGKSARRWGPWGQGHIVVEKASLSDITVSEVFDKAKGALEK